MVAPATFLVRQLLNTFILDSFMFTFSVAEHHAELKFQATPIKLHIHDFAEHTQPLPSKLSACRSTKNTVMRVNTKKHKGKSKLI